jgi:predicted aldo/keto reductase-like oxidoreductase
MPCPSGVDIPTCFEVYNNLAMFGNSGSAKILYLTRLGGAMGGEPVYASLCENCGKCEDACPQNLPIQELLQDVAEEFEKWWMRPTIWVAKRFFALHRWVTLRKARRAEKRK